MTRERRLQNTKTAQALTEAEQAAQAEQAALKAQKKAEAKQTEQARAEAHEKRRAAMMKQAEAMRAIKEARRERNTRELWILLDNLLDPNPNITEKRKKSVQGKIIRLIKSLGSTPKTKQCGKCRQILPDNFFSLEGAYPDSQFCDLCLLKQKLDRREYRRRYHKSHPEVAQAAWQRRRARLRTNGGTLTAQEIKALRDSHGDQCTYCKSVAPLTIDHIIPLSQGGRNDIDNVCLVCFRCNVNKNARTPEQWLNRWYERKRR